MRHSYLIEKEIPWGYVLRDKSFFHNPVAHTMNVQTLVELALVVGDGSIKLEVRG